MSLPISPVEPRATIHPRDDTPLELKRAIFANDLIAKEPHNFEDVEDPDNDESIQETINFRFQLLLDTEEYEAKYGYSMGMSREDKLKEIMEHRRANEDKELMESWSAQNPEEAEEELRFIADIFVQSYETLAQIKAQRVVRKERKEGKDMDEEKRLRYMHPEAPIWNESESESESDEEEEV